eukprot:CAMPEP_0206213824 /NCGR_PEP_ID=MMETSP0047_2-20121206/1327_1 /ASSEMBLY_ACC=CAM_ASM_000192 /TAXON_ID=195065 /ORGANISM="Chroomonas mesostigmatica_cf, Strain CCMP1168" /LENGTH=49 /DNA_ID=CAMNT_0053635997 /DNA_START=21 /DNA_END=170 /DNA_ORIENTATION=+
MNQDSGVGVATKWWDPFNKKSLSLSACPPQWCTTPPRSHRLCTQRRLPA